MKVLSSRATNARTAACELTSDSARDWGSRYLAMLIMLMLVITFCLCSLQLRAASFEMFKYFNAKQVSSQKSIAAWNVELNSELRYLQEGDSFDLNLPTGPNIQVLVERVSSFDNGDIQLLGKFSGHGSVLLTLGTQVSFGNINSDRHSFSISIDSQGAATLFDHTTFPVGTIDLTADMFTPIQSGISAKELSSEDIAGLKNKALKMTDNTQIDVLVVYSSEFKEIFTSPETRINQLIGFGNSAFSRSDILVELNLERAIELPFNNDANLGTSLSQATDGVAAFSNLHTIRDAVGADLVVILHADSSFSASGVGWISGNRPDLAYSATRISQACCDSVFIHEIGHNFGSGHARLSVNPDQTSPCTSGFTGYSCAHGNSVKGWGTIMSYLDSNSIGGRFSNPAQTCQGEPCGIPEGSPNAADNQASFNITRLLVAQFRSKSAHRLVPTITNLVLDE